MLNSIWNDPPSIDLLRLSEKWFNRNTYLKE
jgi:hypothetical protein